MIEGGVTYDRLGRDGERIIDNVPKRDFSIGQFVDARGNPLVILVQTGAVLGSLEDLSEVVERAKRLLPIAPVEVAVGQERQ